jgi:hypothetical protein
LAVNKALEQANLSDYKIIIHGVGFACKQDIATIDSESAALSLIQWIGDAHNNTPQLLNELRYNTRNNDLPVEPMPSLEDLYILF